MTLSRLPKVFHTYQNHHFDSTRWNSYLPRADDIVIATSIKSGTTWMQLIVLQLIFLGQPVPALAEVSPWLDFRPRPIEEVIALLEAQQHRRVIKSHLPLDGLPFHPQLKYIVVGRDPRDVFMSLWNHYANYTPVNYARFNDTPGRVGDPLPPCPEDIHEFWHNWNTRGWFAWEREGYPFWGNLHHAQTWWDFHRLDNILLVHFNDLLTNLAGEIKRVASFLEIAVSEASLIAIVEAVGFSAVKQNAERLAPSASLREWKGGAQAFFYKGTNGRWKEVLSPDELALYERARSQVLTVDCANWLAQGRAALI